jgi:hypothetical protein
VWVRLLKRKNKVEEKIKNNRRITRRKRQKGHGRKRRQGQMGERREITEENTDRVIRRKAK